jgi:deltex-like protein
MSDSDYATATEWIMLTTDEYDPDELCGVMQEPLGDGIEEPVVRLKCGCMFMQETITSSLRMSGRQCPLCKFAYPLLGSQPDGQLEVQMMPQPCEGCRDCGTICFTYSFPSGVQGPMHPHEGQAYSGTSRICFLPDNTEGRETMQLLHKAFTAGLVFNVGKSVTTGRDNTTIWGNIHHKTQRDGGKDCHGWPDDTYFDRVRSECAAQGIYSDEMAKQMQQQQQTAAQANHAGAGGGSSKAHGGNVKAGGAANDMELADVQRRLQAAMAKGWPCFHRTCLSQCSLWLSFLAGDRDEIKQLMAERARLANQK